MSPASDGAVGNPTHCAMLKAIIWDFDGTIVDTETPQFDAWNLLFREYGTSVESSLWAKMVGTVTDFDLVDVLQSRVGGVDRPQAFRRIGELMRSQLKNAPLRPGVRALIDAARIAGFKQAIASSSGRRWIVDYAQRYNLQQSIDVIASADDVARVKPDQAVYLSALQRLGLDRHECLAIEDSPHGAKAALRAGLWCVVVPNPSTDRLVFPPGVTKLKTLADVTVDQLVSSWSLRYRRKDQRL